MRRHQGALTPSKQAAADRNVVVVCHFKSETGTAPDRMAGVGGEKSSEQKMCSRSKNSACLLEGQRKDQAERGRTAQHLSPKGQEEKTAEM